MSDERGWSEVKVGASCMQHGDLAGANSSEIRACVTHVPVIYCRLGRIDSVQPTTRSVVVLC